MIKNICSVLLLIISSVSYGQEFISIWNTNNTEAGSSANNQITIPINPAYTNYNYTVDWGDGNTDTGVTGAITHTYATPGTYTVEIGGTFPSIFFDDSGDKVKIIEILQWGAIQWQTMENAFFGCVNLNFDAINPPDLSQVASLQNMFRDCTNFNGIVNNWDISTVTNISGVFAGCETFNRPLANWNTIAVTDMSDAFYDCHSFNEPLDSWNTASVTNMKNMFYACVAFNQNINNWDVGQVTDMSGMFVACRRFNQPLNTWNVSQVTDMNFMFFRTNDFNQDLSNWQVGNVTNMSRMFHESAITYPMNDWDVSKVTNMNQMFADTPNFNQPLNNWDVSAVTDMSDMFEGARLFNQPLNDWDVSSVTDMSGMFSTLSASPTYSVVFNQPLNNWNVSNVTDMSEMFENNPVFNQALNSWDVSSVTNMQRMFTNADAFNQPLNGWDVSNVTDMRRMFSQNDGFNQPINTWNVSNVTSFQNMFSQATAFDQHITSWDTSSITDMSGMFNQASSFDQNLGNWDISAVINMTDMLSNSGISQENYDNILIGWSAQTVNTGIALGAVNMQYCDALIQRQSLIDDDGWTITGDNVNCSYVLCTEITMPHTSDTATPANSDIRWNPAPNATGYYIDLEVERGGVRSVVNFNGSLASNLDVGNVVGLSFTNEFLAGDTVFITVTPYNNDGPATGCPEVSFTVVDSWVNSPEAFKITIDTRNLDTNSSAGNQYRLELNTGYPDYLTYDFNIDWGDGQYDNNVSSNITHTYLTPGIYTIAIIGNFPSFRQSSSNRDNLKLIAMDQWGSQVWESMNQAFYFCENMEYNATDVPDLSQVTDMQGMFRRNYLFNGNINSWNVSNVTDMTNLFYQASIFNQPLDSWDVSNVTKMHGMFQSASLFNQNINNWDTGNVTDMGRMFRQAKVFNQPLNNWNVGNVTNMEQVFSYTDEFNQPLNNWDVQNVQNTEEMFNYAKAFNQAINSWNVGNVTNMKGMFQAASVFNQPLNSWNVSAVTNMNTMFSSAPVFNQSLNNWDVSSVTDMSSMFSGASAFNQNINSWNVTNVISMWYMFSSARSFDSPLNNWDVNSVVNMSNMFRRAEVFNQPLNNWDVSAVANMTSMFEGAVLFNQPINTWDVSSVTLMESMFEGAEVFNQPLNNWSTAVVTNFNAMFKNTLAFNEPLANWDTSEALSMAEMFSGAALFNHDLNSWDVTYVTTMEDMFKGAAAFNHDLDSWNVASVTTMQGMFQDASAFNGAISSWNVRGVTTMQDMFNGATSFNQSLNNWRINGVTNMNGMFQEASSFNQSFELWNLGTVSMRNMFHDATSFNQYLGVWDISSVTNMQNMLDDTAIVRENYDNTLIAWSEQNLTSGIDLGAANLPYCDAVEERQSIIDNFGWNITGDVLDCPIPECTQLVSPLNGATDVPVNTNLTWQEVLYARAYKLTVRIEPSGTIINETVVNATSYQFTNDFTGGETVYVSIVPSNENGDAVGPCTEESFTVSSTPAAVPVCTILTLPTNGATDVAVNSDLSWNPISNADGYKLTLGTTSGGSDILNEDVGNVTTYNLPTDLPEDTTIYVSVIPYNNLGDANTCSEASFTTETIPAPPACTNLTSPLNGATNVPIDTDLSWTAVDGATGYLVVVGTTQGGIETVNNVDVLNATTYNIPDDLSPNRTYYVTVIPYNEIGDAIGCTEESFRTGAGTVSDPPACTSLTAPLNNAIDVAIDTNISWNTASNATGYKLTVGTTSGGSDILNEDVGNVTTYNLTSNLPENTQIFVTLIPYNAIGDATGCTAESFTTIGSTATDPNCTTLTSPLNNATDVDVTTNLTWNAVSNADGYRISIGTTAGGTEIINNENVGNVTTFDPSYDLPEITTIYVRIRPYNATGDAINCTEESFITKTLGTVPNCSTLSSPLNNATNVDITTNLTWNAVSDTDGYKITIGTTPGGTEITNNENVGNVTTFNPTNDLPENTTIYVRVIPYNTAGDAAACSEESFTTIGSTATVPDCTTLSGPLNNAMGAAVATSLTWNAVDNADGYRLSIGTSAGGSEILDNENVGNVTIYNPANHFPENTRIYVRLTPFNATGNAVGCTEESFTTNAPTATVPDCTTLSGPMNNATNVDIATNITWNAVDNVDGYRLSIGTTAGGSEILDNENVGNVTIYNPANHFPENTRIYVRLTPFNATGNAVGCTEESFTTNAPTATVPDCTTLSGPMNNATNVDIATNITWNAVDNVDGYRLSIGTTTGGSEILDNENVGNVTVYDPTNNFPENTRIYVRLTPFNATGNATNCTEESFTTNAPTATVPDCTTLSGPMNNATNVDIATNITWNAVDNVDGYRLSIGTTAGGSEILDNENVGNVTVYDPTNDFPENTRIYVRLTPFNATGNAVGCTEENFVTEELIDETKYGFSPNGDGFNDDWQIIGIENYPDNTVSIYNRWGDLVFQVNGYNNSSNVFRGTANRLTGLGAGELPNGTYFFDIKINGTHKLKKLKGFVVLKR